MRKSKSEETTKLLGREKAADVPRSVHTFAESDGDGASSRRSVKSSRVTLETKEEEEKVGVEEEETQTIGYFVVPTPAPIPPAHHSVLGIALALLCAIALSFSGFLTKFLITSGIPAENCIMWRGPVVGLVSSSWLIQIFCCTDTTALKAALWPPTLKGRFKVLGILILSRAIIGPISIASQFFSLTYLPLGDSNTVIYSAAVFVPIFAYCLLHEAWGVVPFLAGLLTAIGVMIISKPAFLTGEKKEESPDRAIGFGLAIVAMLCNISVYISVRYLSNLPGVLLVWLMSISTFLLGLVLSLSMGRGIVLPTAFQPLGAILGLMTMTAVGQFSLVYALRFEEASTVSLIRCSEIVFGFLYQMAFGVYPDAWSVGGASLVIFSFALVFLRKYLQHLPVDNRWKHRLRCLLM